jgi:hypothetical protein
MTSALNKMFNGSASSPFAAGSEEMEFHALVVRHTDGELWEPTTATFCCLMRVASAVSMKIPECSR